MLTMHFGLSAYDVIFWNYFAILQKWCCCFGNYLWPILSWYNHFEIQDTHKTPTRHPPRKYDKIPKSTDSVEDYEN